MHETPYAPVLIFCPGTVKAARLYRWRLSADGGVNLCGAQSGAAVGFAAAELTAATNRVMRPASMVVTGPPPTGWRCTVGGQSAKEGRPGTSVPVESVPTVGLMGRWRHITRSEYAGARRTKRP